MQRSQFRTTWRQQAPLILPSLLLCDFSDLKGEVARLEEAGVLGLHLDVMDGRFVPNMTYGLPIVEAVRRLTELPLDVHLMIEEPQCWAKRFVDAGADVVTVHREAISDPLAALSGIQELGVWSGLAINPASPLEVDAPYWAACDLALVMSVPAGFGGQAFDASTLGKTKALKAKYGDKLLVEMDGGINRETIARCAEAGAVALVVGSAIFRHPHYPTAIAELNALARSRNS